MWPDHDNRIRFTNGKPYFYSFSLYAQTVYNSPEIKKEHLISVYYDDQMLNTLTFTNNLLIIFIRCENEKITFS